VSRTRQDPVGAALFRASRRPLQASGVDLTFATDSGRERVKRECQILNST